MNEEYWIEGWQNEKNPRFHQLSTNPDLQSFLDAFDYKTGDIAFVPLCGKSLDLIYLLQSGFQVVGVELSSIAIESFFKENKITYSKERNRYKAKELPLTIIQSNIFNIEDSIPFHFVYDRACLVAFPKQMRENYIQKLMSLSKSPFEILLISLEFPKKQDDEGPPFSVKEDEIKKMYKNKKIQILDVQQSDDRIKTVYKIY